MDARNPQGSKRGLPHQTAESPVRSECRIEAVLR